MTPGPNTDVVLLLIWHVLTRCVSSTHTHTHYEHYSLRLLPPTACMREQLSQALANQQSLTIERDQAREQAKVATERADKLQKQLDLLRQTHGKANVHCNT